MESEEFDSSRGRFKEGGFVVAESNRGSLRFSEIAKPSVLCTASGEREEMVFTGVDDPGTTTDTPSEGNGWDEDEDNEEEDDEEEEDSGGGDDCMGGEWDNSLQKALIKSGRCGNRKNWECDL